MNNKNTKTSTFKLFQNYCVYVEKLEICRKERRKLLINEAITDISGRKKKRCTRKENISLYRNNIASNMRRTKSIQNKLNDDEK